MKLRILLGILTIALVGILSFYLGQKSQEKETLHYMQLQLRDYESACHMSDLIRCYQDYLISDTICQDWGCFEELMSIYLYDDSVVDTPVDLGRYSWCY